MSKRFSREDSILETDWRARSTLALHWLRRSIRATGGKGSAHSWHSVLGWSKAYPETTGYIIPTLMDYAVLHQDESLKVLAYDCANWLINIQLPSGAFPGLLVGNTKPSVFNSAQILFGLARMASEYPSDDRFFMAMKRAATWLLSILEPDGAWRRFAFVEGFTPSYYTRAVWAMLRANEILHMPEIQTGMTKALQFYEGRFLDNHAVLDWGFRPGKPAFTHTIAYTLEGFLEAALLLSADNILSNVCAGADQFLLLREQAGGKTAGCYDENWKGDYSFICPTGHAQLSVFYQRLDRVFQRSDYRLASADLLLKVIDSQVIDGNNNRRGAIPGSIPIWGPYLPFRYPNWGVKFLLDAMIPHQI